MCSFRKFRVPQGGPDLLNLNRCMKLQKAQCRRAAQIYREVALESRSGKIATVRSPSPRTFILMVALTRRDNPSTCGVLVIDRHVRGLYRCLWYARGLRLCPCVITTRGLLPSNTGDFANNGKRRIRWWLFKYWKIFPQNKTCFFKSKSRQSVCTLRLPPVVVFVIVSSSL